MGKLAMLMSLMTVAFLGNANLSALTSQKNIVSENSDLQNQTLAYQFAESGINVVISQVKHEYESYRGDNSAPGLDDGGFTTTATSEDDGSVTVTSIGNADAAAFYMSATVYKGYSRILDAVTFSSPRNDIRLDGDARISGIDRNLDGTRGSGLGVHGLLATDQVTVDAVWNDATEDQITGRGGEGDVKLGPEKQDLDQLATDILSYGGMDQVTLSTYEAFHDSLGSAAAPMVVIVEDGIRLHAHTKGYGILYIKGGDVRFDAQSSWEGLVFVDGDSDVSMAGGSRIMGAIVVRDDEESLDDRHDYDIEMAGNSRINYSTEALQRLGGLIDLFNPNTWPLDATSKKLSSATTEIQQEFQLAKYIDNPELKYIFDSEADYIDLSGDPVIQ
jgi:hypothetical protein